MTHKFISLIILSSLTAAIFVPAPAAASEKKAERNARFRQIVEQIDAGDRDGLLSEIELIDFLLRNKSKLVEQLINNKIGSLEKTLISLGVCPPKKDGEADPKDKDKKSCITAQGVAADHIILDESMLADVVKEAVIDFEMKLNAGGNNSLNVDALGALDNWTIEPFGVKFSDLLVGGRPPKKDTKKRSTLQAVQSWVSVRKSYLNAAGLGKSGNFGWTRFGKSDETLGEGADRSVYQVNAALIFHPPGNLLRNPIVVANRSLAISLVGVWEADFSTDKTTGTITHRLGFNADLTSCADPESICDPIGLFSGQNFKFTFNYITDRKYKADVYGLTFQYTFGGSAAAIGKFKEVTENLAFRWRPYLGFDYANIDNPGINSNFEKMNSYKNLFARVDAEFELFNRLKLNEELLFTKQLAGEKGGNWFSSTSLEFPLDKNKIARLTISYDLGRKPPALKKSSQVKAGFGVKF